MPTVTTTVTSAAASGVTTTVTTTAATPEPEPAAAAAAAGTLAIPNTRKGKCLKNVFGAENVTSFPADADSVSKEWLSAALNAPVESFKTTICAMGQVSNTLLITEIVYTSGAGINTYGMPKGLALKMNKDEEASRKPCSEMCLYTREVYFYSSGIQAEVPVLSPEVYGVWTDGTENDEFNCIMLEDMNQDWKGFSGYDGCPPLKQWVGILGEVQKIHIQYWKSLEIQKPPMSMSGAKFTVDDWRGPISTLPTALPVFRDTITTESYAGKALPSEWQYYFDFMEWMSADNNRRMDAFMNMMEAELADRPMTLCHGDFNCGNFWESKEKPGVYNIADWQLLKMSPIVLDFVTPFATIETDEFTGGKWKQFLLDCYKAYDGTPIATEYPMDMFIHDWKLLQIGFWSFVVPILAGAASLPPGDKRDFTWQKFFPVAGGRFCTLTQELDLWKVARDFLGDEYA